MKNAIVVDIDGVLLDTSNIFKELLELKLTGDSKWDYFYKYCNTEKIPFIEGTLNLLRSLHGIHIFLSTARNERCRKETEQKLLESYVSYCKLLMRRDNDFRPSHEVKKEHLEQIMQEYNIIAFIDDDLSNCQMAKELGIFTLRKV